MKNFIDKNWSHLVLVALLVKSHLLPDTNDHIIILGLAALSGYKMYLNSVFSIKLKDLISSNKKELCMLIEENNSNNAAMRQEIRSLIDSNNEEIKSVVDTNYERVGEALIKVSVENQEAFSKLKTDVGQVGLAQGMGNGKGQAVGGFW